MASPPLDDCFKRAIVLEQRLRKFYLGIAESFSFDEALHRFFLDLAVDEGEHARTLDDARKGEPKSKRLEDRSRDISAKLDKLQNQLDGLLTDDYKDFAGAFKKTHDIEKSEINNLFLILASGVLGVESDESNLRSAMDRHLQKVIDLGARYKAGEMAAIIPRK
jgi:rubrerythrin